MVNLAFYAQGYPVSVEQQDAALAAMTGTFSNKDVQKALRRAGVKAIVIDRATDRLLQAQRKARRIEVARGEGRGMWRVLTDGQSCAALLDDLSNDGDADA